MKPEKRHPRGASGGAGRIERDAGTEKDLLLMFAGLARKLFGSANDRQIKTYRPRVDEINALEK